MNRKKVFCPECRHDVNYTVEKIPMVDKLRGQGYSYIGEIARCNECDSEIYVADVNDYNLRALYAEYRKAKNIVPLDTVLAIPEKYGIGKRPLSLLLGWGEQTFSRYCDGDIPTKQYSEILQHIYEDPRYYEEILESNKGNLKSEVTYRKSRKALDSLLNKDKESRMNIAIEYLLNVCEDITPLSLQKALYYIQGFYYAFYETFLFTEDCQAWVHGPVYRDVYLRFKDYRFDPISYKTKARDLKISSAEKAIFESVANHLCCYSGKVLEQFTHSEAPWLSARGDLLDDQPSDKIISKESIGSYFSNVKVKYDMLNPNDIKDYARVMFRGMHL